jgi:uncharacterized protein YkwD
MKNLFLSLVIVLTSLVSFGQTKKEVVALTEIEQLVFKKINDYLVKNGLKANVWCPESYKAAYHHSYYLSDPNVSISHFESEDVQGVDEINTHNDRICSFLKSPGVVSVENIMTTQASNAWINIKDCDGKKLISDNIFRAWYESESHNKAMLNSSMTHGSIAIVREKDGNYCRPVMVFYLK